MDGTAAMTFDVVVEVPKGSRNKYEWDAAAGAMRLDRQLFTATRCPGDYGFIPAAELGASAGRRSPA
jgi:inorganic pyrophosphatase